MIEQYNAFYLLDLQSYQCVEMEVFPLAFHQPWRSVNFFSWWYSVYYNLYIFDGASFLELQWNLSAFWHFTSLKVCRIVFLMIYCNSFFVDGICFFWTAVKFETRCLPIFGLFQWWVMKRGVELILESWYWWREGGGLVVSILSHLRFVTTGSGVVKVVQKQTFSPCQPAVVIASEKTGNVRCCSR